jgi:predicted  nucleic acid-binding Zn-ribbon protein
MATKQGLSAQISQVSEDAKRAVLQKTSLTNSLWFSSLNTTCTIKSAPPRTPDVLGLLSQKSGWLLKRNEQHVWQARYCCVVPHTFLYYFDAHPSSQCERPQLSSKQQDALNKAVRQGYGKRGALKQQQPRSSLYHVLGSSGNPNPPDEQQEGTASALQPAGIIDLECYTKIHRNSQNNNLLELAGDETVNPDLRSFYFYSNNQDEGEEWTQALLGQRHASLMDEKDAYRQVCDGFASQLQQLHTDLESAQHRAENHQDEMYRVRSQMEDIRRNCIRLVQDTMERYEGAIPAKRAYKTDLATIQGQDLGIQAAVQLLCDYTKALEEIVRDNGNNITEMEKKMEQRQEGDQTKVEQLEKELEVLKHELKQQKTSTQSQIETLQQKYVQSQKECQDVQKDLASQRMEVTMYQSSTRTKMAELQTHKKILKKEVIELRKKNEEVNSELDLYKHKESGARVDAEKERQKANLLERYVEKVESQVKVQQNMMEMMSQAGSVYAGSVAFKSNDHSNSYIVNTPSLGQPDGDVGDADNVDNDDEDSLPGYPIPTSDGKRNDKKERDMIEDDNKSHMSELTEDRTQRQFDAVLMLQQHAALRAMAASSPRSMPPSQSTFEHQQQKFLPPAMIGVSGDEGQQMDQNKAVPKLQTISSVQPQRRVPATTPRNHDIPRYEAKPLTTRNASDASIGSTGSKSKLSVAQRARTEADARRSTPVRIRLNQGSVQNSTPTRGNAAPRKESPREYNNNGNISSNASATGSFFSNIGKRLEDGLDNIIFGEETSYQSTNNGTDVGTDIGTDVGSDIADEKKSQDHSNHQTGVATAVKSVSLF